MNAGLDLAIGDFVFEFDTVFVDYTPEDIMAVYDQALEGFDMVSASPDCKMRRTSRMFYQILDRFSDTPYSMTSERFRILSRRVINRVMSMNNDIPYRKAVYSHCGLKTKNIVYTAAGGDRRGTGRQLGHAERRYRRNLGIDVLLYDGSHDTGDGADVPVFPDRLSVWQSGGRMDDYDPVLLVCFFRAVRLVDDRHQVSADFGGSGV